MLCTIALVAAAWPVKASVNETVPLWIAEIANQPQSDDVRWLSGSRMPRRASRTCCSVAI